MPVLPPSLPPYIVIIDTRSVAGRVLAERVSVLRVRVYGVEGDLTDLWYGDLDPFSKKSPASKKPLVIHSESSPDTGGPLVSWMISLI